MQTEGITEILQAPGKLKDRIQGMSGTRNLSDNLSDLKAQVRPAEQILCSLTGCKGMLAAGLSMSLSWLLQPLVAPA